MPTVQKRNSQFSQRIQNEFSPSGAVRGSRNPMVEDKVYSLFQPDVLVSTQYLATTKSKTQREPEQRLMLAVLEDAVWCFQNGLLSKDKRKRGLFRDAEEWLTEDAGGWLFSFNEICELLGLESKYIRKHLLRWKEAASRTRERTKINRLSDRNAQPRTSGEKRHRYLHAAGF
jgi:hypothetical protein